VVSRAGEVLGGLFFGHAQPASSPTGRNAWSPRWLPQAAVAIDNNRLHQLAQHELGARQTAEAELRQLNETLERRVSERTHELATSGVQLVDAERGLRLLIESVSDYAIYMLDPAGKVMNWNPGRSESRATIAARSSPAFLAVLHEEDRQEACRRPR
jgi:PAS domain-containing protein